MNFIPNLLKHNKKLNYPLFEKKNGFKYVNELIALDSHGQNEVMIRSIPPFYDGGVARTVVCGKTNFVEYASHTYIINKEPKLFEGLSINTHKEARAHGYGEILRLISIIHMKENNLVKNTIDALSNAIPFHFKYGFRPDFSGHADFKQPFKKREYFDPIEYIRETLSLLITDKKAKKSFINNAKHLKSVFEENEALKSNEISMLDSLVYHFIRKHESDWNAHLLIDGLPMRLEMKNIEKNAKFYNQLFKKHGIDYEI